MEFGTNKITPIFIFSLPRSGSTLLQKIIASSNKVSSSSETWVLLPLLFSQKKEGTLTEYSHNKAIEALNTLKKNLLDNSINYNDILSNYILSIYRGLSTNKSKYFLDKTPRYYYIIEEISTIFPNAKFIFLFRDPLSQFASKIHNHNGRFKLNNYIGDLLKGHNLLASGYEKLYAKSIKLSYFEIINNTTQVLEKLNVYLEINIDKKIVNNLTNVKFKGKMGDPDLMSNKNDKILKSSLEKWKDTFNTPVRIWVATKYLKNINDNYFSFLGKNREIFLDELNSVKLKYTFMLRDLYDLIYFYLALKFKLRLFFSKKFKWTRNLDLE